MPEIPVEKKFAVLCQIARAQHFAWREAVAQLPGVDVRAVVETMWALTAKGTAQAYLRRLDRERPLAPQLADSFVWSSLCMGEAAEVETNGAGDEAFVRHDGCPWFDWHQRLGLLEEDQPGCDRWFQTTLELVNEALDTELRIETLESLPAGGQCCVRRLWVESPKDVA